MNGIGLANLCEHEWWEYSVQFTSLGYTAEEFYTILETGMKNGVFNTDKLADAIKEAGIRLREMPDATSEAIKSLGLNVKEVQSGIAKGGESAKKSMREVAEALMGIDDPVKRNLVGIETFGSMWEDCGDVVAKAILGAENEIEGLNGTVDAMNKNLEEVNNGGLLELKNKAIEAFQAIGEKLVPVFSELIDTLTRAVDWFTSLDDGTQNLIVKSGLLVTAISPVSKALSGMIDVTGKLTSALGGIAAKKAADEILEVSTSAVVTSSAIGAGSTGLVGSFAALATAVAPWLIGGALVVGLGLGLKAIHDDMVEQGKQAMLLADTHEGASARMTNAMETLKSEVKLKYDSMKEDMKTFSDEANTALSNAFANAETPTSINLDIYNGIISTKLTETKQIIEDNITDMNNDIALFNTNSAEQTILSWEVINSITKDYGQQMTKEVEVAYNALLTTQKNSALIGQQITDENGQEILYTTEMYYSDLKAAQEEYENACIQSSMGFNNDSLFQVQSLISEASITTVQGYLDALAAAKTQKEELYNIAEENYNSQIAVIQRLSDDQIAKTGFTRDQLLMIAGQQKVQWIAEADEMMVETVDKYKQMAEDSGIWSENMAKQTELYSSETKESCITNWNAAQEEINKITGEIGLHLRDVETGHKDLSREVNSAAGSVSVDSNYMSSAIALTTDQMGVSLENAAQSTKDMNTDASKYLLSTSDTGSIMQNRLSTSLTTMGRSFTTTKNSISRETSSMKDDINSVKGKEVNIVANFLSNGFTSVMNNLKNFVGGVTNAQRTGRTAYVEPSGNENVETYAFSRQSMLGVAAYDYNTVSPYATKDSTASSYVSHSVQNYNNTAFGTIQLDLDTDLGSSQPTRNELPKYDSLIKIDNMVVREDADIQKIAKQLEYYLKINNKKW